MAGAMTPWLKYASLVALVFQTTAAVVLTRYANVHRPPEVLPFAPTSLVTMQEVLKFIFSLMLVAIFDFDSEAVTQRREKGKCEADPERCPPGGDSGDGGHMDVLAGESATEAPVRTASPRASAAPGESVKKLAAVAGDADGELRATMLPSPILRRRGGIAARLAYVREAIYEYNFQHKGETLKVSVPALLYTIQNNLIYIALANLDATVFQVGYQSKIVMTGVLTVWMLPGRHLSLWKWMSLGLLTAGIVMAQLGDTSSARAPAATALAANAESRAGASGAASMSPPRRGASSGDPVVGFVAVLIAACCSGFAGVYFEKVLKTGQRTSVWMRNAQLAFFSSVIAVLGYGASAHRADGYYFFDGYYGLIWAIILTQAAGGLIIAMVIKYADNILKCFATAISIIVCGVVSSLWMGFSPTLLFCAGSVVVIVATFSYSRPDGTG